MRVFYHTWPNPGRKLCRSTAPLNFKGVCLCSIGPFLSWIWDPSVGSTFTQGGKDSKLLEGLQRLAAPSVKGDYQTVPSLTSLLRDLRWQDPKHKQRELQLALLYKIKTENLPVTPQDFGLIKADGCIQMNHHFKVITLVANTPEYHHSFAVDTAGDCT